jgi:DNA segregation ATPase FtsK/SpoIIIE, S-DNA-T family
MPGKKRASRRRRGGKLKLKKNTVYNLFAIGCFIIAGLLFLSFTNSGESTVLMNQILQKNFGIFSLLAPFVFIFFGFYFLKLKLFLSRVTVALGFTLFFFSMMSLMKVGEVGGGVFQTLSEILGVAGADLVFIGGAVVGIIVFFDTSVDEIFQAIVAIGKVFPRLVPWKLFGAFKKKPTEKGTLDRSKPIIKGGQLLKDAAPLPSKASASPITINKKEPELISEKLVTNVLSNTGGGVWEYPPLSLLVDEHSKKADRGDINKTASVIEKTLQSFGVEARVAEVNLGPAVTQYALEIALGTKVSKITSLANDLALATEAPTGQIRIEAPIPGRNLVGIEIPNRSLEVVPLKTMLASQVMQKSKSKLTVSLGLDVSGNPLVADIARMPHILIAGTTGSGKSVMMNSIITTLLFRASPAEVKLILVDPKRVEFTIYNDIPHLLTPVIVEPEKILSALKWSMGEMDRRYKLFAERGVRNIEGYNEISGFQVLPYIVIIIDELADLMMFAPVEVEDAIARIAQMARATGIHLVIATQRPSVNVITGLIKANIPTRIAFSVSSMIDSRVILDSPGAEKLLGRGDMLYIPPDQAKPSRIQGAFIDEKTGIKKLVDFLKSKDIAIEYTEEILNQPVVAKGNKGAPVGTSSSDGRDEMFEEIVRLVCQFDTASASFLQRKMKIGYSRAARILDQLEEVGIVSHAEGSKPREVLVRNAEEFLSTYNQQQE